MQKRSSWRKTLFMAKLSFRNLALATAIGAIIFLNLPSLARTESATREKVLGISRTRTEIVFHTPGFYLEKLFPFFQAPTQTATTTQTTPTTTTKPAPTPTAPKVKTSTPVVTPTPPAAKTIEEVLVDMTNKARSDAGLKPLQVASVLTNLARIRSNDMATKNYFDHTSPTGETAFTLLAANGIGYKTAGENIGRNDYPDSQTAKVVFDAWMNSPGHKANILNPSFSQIGIGMAASASMKYYTQIFIGY